MFGVGDLVSQGAGRGKKGMEEASLFPEFLRGHALWGGAVEEHRTLVG